VARIDEYFHDPHPPPVHGLVVVVYAIVRDAGGRVLLVRRADDGNWELPGGRVEVGETVRPDGEEAIAAAWFTVDETTALATHPAVRVRLVHGLSHRPVPHVD
jgi:8-oxo-dGTP pyrophosphatase MutT (NUDIX family)